MMISKILLAYLICQNLVVFSTGNVLGNKLKGSSNRFDKFSSFIIEAQSSIIKTLEHTDGKGIFKQEPWEKLSSSSSLEGYGITAVIEEGVVLEKGAVSTTIVTGKLSEERAKAISSRSGNPNIKVGDSYSAAALSIVLHSRSPMVPTFRADVRYFEVDGATDGRGAWFGGGADLTPYYLFDEDAKAFHVLYKEICDYKGGPMMYPKFKRWCDEYFYLPARGEHRGVGGIFFDDLSSMNEESSSSIISETDIDKAMEFTQVICDSFMPSYLPIIARRRSIPYTDAQRHWQLLRRGRYIEFNLLYDRGVKFGLVPGGRVEAVMVSCPPLVAWDYNHTPESGSEEERLMRILKQPLEWA